MRVLNDCHVGTLRLKSRELTRQVAWKTILLMQMADFCVSNYNNVEHEHEETQGGQLAICRYYESRSLRCLRDLPPGPYLQRTSRGVVLVLCSSEQQVREHVQTSFPLTTQHSLDNPRVVIGDEAAFEYDSYLHTIEEEDGILCYVCAGSDGIRRSVPVRGDVGAIISTLEGLRRHKWSSELCVVATESQRLPVSLVIVDETGMDANSTQKLYDFLLRFTTSVQYYSSHSAVEKSPPPPRFLSLLPSDSNPFAPNIHLLKVLKWQNQGGWTQTALRDHGGRSTPLSSKIADVLYQLPPDESQWIDEQGSHTANLNHLQSAIHVRLSNQVFRTSGSLQSDWTSMAKQTLLIDDQLSYNTEQAGPSNRLLAKIRKFLAHIQRNRVQFQSRQSSGELYDFVINQILKCQVLASFPSITNTIKEKDLTEQLLYVRCRSSSHKRLGIPDKKTLNVWSMSVTGDEPISTDSVLYNTAVEDVLSDPKA